MPLTRTTWTDLIGTDAAKTSVAFGATSSADIDCNGTNNFHVVGLKVVVVFGATPDGNVTVNLYGKDADQAAPEVDTVPMGGSFSITQLTSTEVRRTVQLATPALDTLTVSVTNNDSADAVTVWVSYLGVYF